MSNIPTLLRLQESHDEVKAVAKERADLQRLQEFLQSEKSQLQENLREMAAKVCVIHFHVCVLIFCKQISW